MKISTLLKQTLIKGFFVNSLFLLIFHSNPLLAQLTQEDNPNLDQIPKYLLQNPPKSPNVPLSTVITLGNWDNFNLGTDFGESNMTSHMQNPAKYFTAYNTNAAHHTENGTDWANVVPNFGATMQGDPVVAYDSLGNLFYENLYGSGSIQGVKVIKSTDNGANWGAAVTGVSGVDKNWIACDQTSGPYANYVYVCMTANSGGNFARSTDNGLTFTTTFSPGTQNVPGMMVCVGAYNNIQGGAVYVVTNSGSPFTSTYTFYRSLDGGATFNQMSAQQFCNTVGSQLNNRNSVEGMRTRPYPMIAADNSYGAYRGRFYNVYASNDPPGNGNKPDIFCRYSTDGGATFSSAVKINDDPNTQNNHQWHPGIWCDKETGRLYAMWMDTRDTPTHDSAYIYASYSDDGGQTFVANQRISNKKMKIDCGSCGGGGTPRYQGDYNGITSNKKGGQAGWTDFRQNTFMSVTAYFPDFAMAIDHTADTLYTSADSATFQVSIPEVKLYSDTVILSGVLTPTPASGIVVFHFPSGNTITTFPNTKPVNVVLYGNVPTGSYTANFYASGPNGTPVHKRTATIKVLQGNTFLVDATATPSTISLGQNSQLDATVIGGSAPFIFSWTPLTGLTDPSLQNPIANPIITTVYHVLVSDATSHTASDSVVVNVTPNAMSITVSASPATICQGQSSQLNVFVSGGLAPYIYSWTPPIGLSDPAIQNPLADPLATTMYHVTVTDAVSQTVTDSVLVKVNTGPATPGPISGSQLVCLNSTSDYTIAEVTNATNYSWTVPAGDTILSGQNTNYISVLWRNNAAGNISVIAGNECGNSIPSVLQVSINLPPDTLGSISGPVKNCKSAMAIYSVAKVTNADVYLWTVPSGATITSGQNTDSIDVTWGAHAGDISVYAQNECGNTNAVVKMISVDSIPSAAGSITGKDTVCKSQNGYSFSVDDISGALSYDWTLPSGMTISTQNGKEITVDVSLTADTGTSTITVKGINECGVGTENSKVVYISNCNGINESLLKGNISIFPNPTNHLLNIAFRSYFNKVMLVVTDMNGKEMFTESLENIRSGFLKQINVSQYSKGLYFIKLTENNQIFKEKFVVQ